MKTSRHCECCDARWTLWTGVWQASPFWFRCPYCWTWFRIRAGWLLLPLFLLAICLTIVLTFAYLYAALAWGVPPEVMLAAIWLAVLPLELGTSVVFYTWATFVPPDRSR